MFLEDMFIRKACAIAEGLQYTIFMEKMIFFKGNSVLYECVNVGILTKLSLLHLKMMDIAGYHRNNMIVSNSLNLK